MSLKNVKSKLLLEFKQVTKEKDPKVFSAIEAVVILSGESAGAVAGNRIGDTEQRTNYAIKIFKQIKALGGFPTLVLNGTDVQNKLMAKLARRAGVFNIVYIKNPPFPRASTDTQMKGLAKLNFKKVAIITHGRHSLRANMTALKRLPKNTAFSLFLVDRKKMDQNDINEEIEKIIKYFNE
jgi:hypothetical protein